MWRFVQSNQIGIDILVFVVAEVLIGIQYDMPQGRVIIPCKVAGGVYDFFIISGMMVHVDTLVVQSINGIFVARS